MSLIRNFADDFAVLTSENADRPMFLLDDDGVYCRTFTYAAVAEYIDSFLIYFNKQGLCPGDTIVSLLPNSVEAMLCFLATIKGGYGYAPLPCNVSEREFSNWVGLVKPKLCLKKAGLNYDADERPMAADFKTAEIECNSKLDWLPNNAGFVPENGTESRLYLYTSGTTGEGKAIVINSNTLWSSGCAFSQYHHLEGKNIRIWNYLPMSYLGGLFNLGLIPICSGGSIVIGEPFSGKTFLNFWNTVQRFEINSLWLVPTIARGLLQIASLTNHHGITNISKTISWCFLGTAPVSLRTKTEFEEVFGIRLYENYGLSETSFISSETQQNVTDREEGSVGEVLPYIQLKLVPQDGSTQIMEIRVKSPFLFCGYLTADGKTELPLDQDGYFSTGDTGIIRENGQLLLIGRRADIIKKGGLFVSLQEIEMLVSQLDYIEDAAAVRIKHDFYGESYVLFVVPKAKETDVESRLEKWFHGNVVSYKWPDRINVKSSLAKTPSGKIKKKVLGEFL